MIEKDNIQKILCEFGKKRGSTVVAFFFPKSPIRKKHLFGLKKEIGTERLKTIDTFIHSGGGDIHTTYQIVEFLRLHCDSLHTFIPLYAKSAATLLCLGANSIVLGEFAELGPLDTQVLELGKGGKREYVSALNPFKTLEQLQKFSLETLDVAVKMIVARSGMEPADALEHATKFVSVATEPLLRQLNSEKLGEYNRALSVGAEYAERLLRRYHNWDEQKRRNIIEKLIYGYPSHDYIIDYKELKELGFDVGFFEGDLIPIVNPLTELLVKYEGDEVIVCKQEPSTRKVMNTSKARRK